MSIGLTFIYPELEAMSELNWYVVQARLALTEDGRLVPEGHADARWLYAIPGQYIPLADAERYGLVKARPKAEDKAAKRPANKSA